MAIKSIFIDNHSANAVVQKNTFKIVKLEIT